MVGLTRWGNRPVRLCGVGLRRSHSAWYRELEGNDGSLTLTLWFLRVARDFVEKRIRWLTHSGSPRLFFLEFVVCCGDIYPLKLVCWRGPHSECPIKLVIENRDWVETSKIEVVAIQASVMEGRRDQDAVDTKAFQANQVVSAADSTSRDDLHFRKFVANEAANGIGRTASPHADVGEIEDNN